MARIEGDFERFAERALEPYFREAVRKVDQARDDGIRLVEESYRSVLEGALKRLRSKGEEARERLQGLKSRYDLEVKNVAESVKDRLITKLLEEALEEFRKRKGESKVYRGYLDKVLRDVVQESGGSVRRVVVAPEDRALVEGLLSTLGVGSVAIEEDSSIYGGVIVELGGGVRVDYSINNILTVEEPRLRRAARKALFGE